MNNAYKIADLPHINADEFEIVNGVYFSQDIWDFNHIHNIEEKQPAKNFRFDFSDFLDFPAVKNVVKRYMAYKILDKKISTAKRNFDGCKPIIRFINDLYPELSSFKDFNEEILREYYIYLLQLRNPNTNQLQSDTTVKKNHQAIKEILLVGSSNDWEVPDDVSYVNQLSNQLILNNKELSKRKNKTRKRVENRVLDDDLYQEVIEAAISDLNNETNIIVSAGILITSQIGLRITELLSLKEDCLTRFNGELYISFWTTKLKKEGQVTEKPANELVELAINKLKEFTKPLRREKNSSYLFLNRNRNKKGFPVININSSNWSKNYLQPWIRRHKLKYKNGEYIDFTSHTFRHGFASYAYKNGMELETISNMMGHTQIRGTEHYLHLTNQELESKYNQIFSSDSILAGRRASKIKDKLKQDNPFKGKDIEKLEQIRKAMKIKFLPHGLCLHHPLRNEPCEGAGVCLGCDNYITTPDFKEVHKNRLARVQEELASAQKDGPFEKKMRHIEQNLVEILRQLEGQSDGQ